MGFVFVGYMTISIVVTFWNSAIVANSHIRLTGGDPKFMDGVSAAMSKIHIIILWGIIAGTVGLLLTILNQAARNQKGGAAVFAMILTAIGAAVWWMMTFFMIPHMILENQRSWGKVSNPVRVGSSNRGEKTSPPVLGLESSEFFFIAVIAILNLWNGRCIRATLVHRSWIRCSGNRCCNCLDQCR